MSWSCRFTSSLSSGNSSPTAASILAGSKVRAGSNFVAPAPPVVSMERKQDWTHCADLFSYGTVTRYYFRNNHTHTNCELLAESFPNSANWSCRFTSSLSSGNSSPTAASILAGSKVRAGSNFVAPPVVSMERKQDGRNSNCANLFSYGTAKSADSRAPPTPHCAKAKPPRAS